jgi:hypothetical protein
MKALTNKELWALVQNQKTINDNKNFDGEIVDFPYEYIGVRFENKERQIGDICENSKHNPDRDDERDFPKFDSEEYAELPELIGTSAWDLRDIKYLINRENWIDSNANWDYAREVSHCYIIAGNDLGNNNVTLDDCEICIVDAKVIAVIV